MNVGTDFGPVVHRSICGQERFVALVESGEQGILLLVHSRRAARALRERILADLGSSTDQVRVTTWHAFGLSLLRAHHGALGYQREPALLTGPEQFTLVRDMLAEDAERGARDGRVVPEVEGRGDEGVGVERRLL